MVLSSFLCENTLRLLVKGHIIEEKKGCLPEAGEMIIMEKVEGRIRYTMDNLRAGGD